MKSAMATDVRRGEYRELARVPFDEYALQWIDSYQGRTSGGVRPATVADYKRSLERHALPYFGRRLLGEIEPRDLKGFIKATADKGLSPNSVRLAVAPVRALFATAFEEGLIRSSPAAGVRISGIVRTTDDGEVAQVKALTEGELQALLTNTDPEWRPFVAFMAQTGMRIGEAIAIRWIDVDFGRRRVSVKRRWYAGTFAPPKSRYGRRSIPITEEMAKALWERRKHAREAKDSALVWPTRSGTPHSPSNLSTRVLKPAANASDVPWVGWHTLRHTCATILFRHGVNAKQVQTWLGHHSPAFTLATYVHLLPDDAPDPSFLDAVMPWRAGVGTTPSTCVRPESQRLEERRDRPFGPSQAVGADSATIAT
jgi:integrase